MSIEAPARAVVREADAAYARSRHENAGFLSEATGFMPRRPPLLALPDHHAAWDRLAAALPEVVRAGRVGEAFAGLPVLGAGELPDASLLRAATILGIFAHVFRRLGGGDGPLPDAVVRPWQEVTRRLGRRAPSLSYIDLIVYNWRTLDDARGPLRVERLGLLVPTVDNAEERNFYLTQVEILARCTPIVAAVVAAQDAALAGDGARLAGHLRDIADGLRTVTAQALPKIDPRPDSRFVVDPVTWAKTVAPLAVPVDANVAGPSGTASPIFHLLDVFFGRRRYDTFLGREAIHLRDWYPARWTSFLGAVAEVDVRAHVERLGGRELRATYRDALDAYAGEDGFLGRHRLKVYGYLDLAFKAGRTMTIGGFSGVFKDREWEQIDGQLEASRAEREPAGPAVERLRVAARAPAADSGAVVRITLDTAGTGLRFAPGDRCAVLPQQRPELIRVTLEALRARGDEMVDLDRAWRDAVVARGDGHRSRLALADLLRLGRIRPIERPVARLLALVTGSERLRRIVDEREEDQWELWDLVGLAADEGFDPGLLWRAHPADPESICRIVPPELPRYYSIASRSGEGSHLDLAVGSLVYETASGTPRRRRGTASAYLAGVAVGDSVPVRLVHAAHFRLPEDATQPVILFAGGSGLSPFRAFLQERSRHARPGETHLFACARTAADVPFRADLEDLAGRMPLDVRYVLSRDPSQPERIEEVIARPATVAMIRRLLAPAGAGAAYVCGGVGFAQAVTRALEAVLPEDPSLAGLAAAGRFSREVFTTYTGPRHQARRVYDASEVLRHNDEAAGFWTVLDGRVYDLTGFERLHPGGHKIVRAYAGMDATAVYRAAGHATDPSVDALRGLYELGVVRRLDFGAAYGISIGARGLELTTVRALYQAWISTAHLVVEMQNAHANDRSIREAPVARGEAGTDVSPFKLALLREVHPRFVHHYVEPLCAGLIALWAPTSGACSGTEDIGWMARRLAAADAAADEADTLEVMEAAEARDAGLLDELKEILRQGLVLFERHEDRVLRDASGSLLELARRLPDAVVRWRRDVAARLAAAHSALPAAHRAQA